MKKLRNFDLKDKGPGACIALCDLERKLDEIGLNSKHIDKDDEHFRDKVFVTDSVWVNVNDGFYGMTFELKRHIPRFLAVGYLKMLLWFAKHGAYEDRGELA